MKKKTTYIIRKAKNDACAIKIMKEIRIPIKLSKEGLKFFSHLRNKKTFFIFRKNDKLNYPNVIRVFIEEYGYSQIYNKSYWEPEDERIIIK